MSSVPQGSLAHYVGAMGNELGIHAYELREDFNWLKHKWNEFSVFFSRGQDQIDLLNRAASNFFYFLHKMMFEDAMLHLSRLTDPAGQGSRTNKTLCRLPGLISDRKLKNLVDLELRSVQDKCQFARKWRDKALAHTDLQTARKNPGSLLPAVLANNVDSAVASIDSFLWLIEEHFALPPTLFVGDPFGASSLMHRLKAAIAAEDKYEQELKELIRQQKSIGSSGI